MKLLATMPAEPFRGAFLTEEIRGLLEESFEVTWNPLDRNYTSAELAEAIEGQDVVLTGWGTPSLTAAEIRQKAGALRLVAHTAGSVADLVDAEYYARGVRVISGNRLFAESVAEGALAYMLLGQRHLTEETRIMAAGGWKKAGVMPNAGLLDKTIGLVGYGAVTRCLAEMLMPFHPRLLIWSGHRLDAEDLAAHRAEQVRDLTEVFARSDIVSLHSALNEITSGMIGAKELSALRSGALLVNTARAGLIQERALMEALAEGRFRTVLDVYHQEPLPADSPLRGMPNVLCLPHRAGPTTDRYPVIGAAVAQDAIRFARGEKMLLELQPAEAARMTKHMQS